MKLAIRPSKHTYTNIHKNQTTLHIHNIYRLNFYIKLMNIHWLFCRFLSIMIEFYITIRMCSTSLSHSVCVFCEKNREREGGETCKWQAKLNWISTEEISLYKASSNWQICVIVGNMEVWKLGDTYTHSLTNENDTYDACWIAHNNGSHSTKRMKCFANCILW